MKRISVTQFCRRPALGAFSIERVFRDVRDALPFEVDVVEHRNMHLSRGVFPRLKDAWAARRAARNVNHVIGDVHYLTYFLPRDTTILTVHDTVLVERERGIKKLILWIFWLWLPMRCCDRITTISEESRRRILALVGVDPERIEVIPNPVGGEFIPVSLPPRNGPFRLLHIGTKPNKNLERLIRAIDGLDVELTVIGRLTLDQQVLLKTHVPRCRSLFDLDDSSIRTEYARAEALVFVSLDEGFGMPILEAQATGRPVVTSNRAPMKEVAGDAAILIDPEDEAAIRNAILRLISDADVRRTLVARGHSNTERFQAATVAKQYAQLYRRVGNTGRNV